jgi:hypothetical protein
MTSDSSVHSDTSSFDGTRHQLRLSKNPKTEKVGTHNPFVFKDVFSVKMPKLDFFDSLVRRPQLSI